VRIPEGVSFEAAATLPVAGLTALQGLRDAGRIQAGQQVLINGASGGVGTFAVQVAKIYGAEVTGVCRTRNLELVRSIGADHVIDYTRQDFTRMGPRYDLIFDVAANHTVFALQRALKPRGRHVMAGFSTLPHMLHVMTVGRWISSANGRSFGSMGVAVMNQADLALLAGWLQSGRLTPVIDDRYPLSRTAEAMRYFEEEHAQGKVVVTVPG
jgi:NADPH:quinone reductase-like Zn-dependent oxidoreductase